MRTIWLYIAVIDNVKKECRINGRVMSMLMDYNPLNIYGYKLYYHTDYYSYIIRYDEDGFYIRIDNTKIYDTTTVSINGDVCEVSRKTKSGTTLTSSDKLGFSCNYPLPDGSKISLSFSRTPPNYNHI